MDAKRLEGGFSNFKANDLQTLGTGKAIARVERSDFDFNLKTIAVESVEPDLAKSRRDAALAASRATYAHPRSEIESEIAAYWASIRQNEEAASPTPKQKAPAPSQTAVRAEPTAPKAPSAKAQPTATPPAATSPTPPKRREATPAKPKTPEPSPGRGGPEHKYLQTLIKRLAEDRGYRASVEESILGGAGSVDVSLKIGEQKVACEICVTTTSEHELANIQKCLAAGYATVVLIARDAKALRAVQSAAEAALAAETLEHLRFLSPEEFLSYLEELSAAAASTEESVRGYKVKVNYKPVSKSEAEARRQALSKILLERAKRGKKKSEA